MVEVSKTAPPTMIAQIKKIAAPNEMLALYMPKDFLNTADGNTLPEDLIIIAVPKGNPNVPLDQFPLLKDALRPSFEQAQAVIYADNERWMGATRPYVVPSSQKTYLFSTSVVSVRSYALMVQYLKQAKQNSDVASLHTTMGFISEYLISLNATDTVPQVQTAPTTPPVQIPSPNLQSSPKQSSGAKSPSYFIKPN